MALLSSLRRFCDFLDPIVKLLLIPMSVVFIYAGAAWLNENYVDRATFKATISEVQADRERSDQEQRLAFREISGKLDAILQSNAANSQRFTDTERRLSRLEDKVDGLKGN